MVKQRTTLVGSAIRFLFALIATSFLAGCKVELHSNLEESEANAMMAKLLSEGIDVTKVMGKDGVSLMVNSRQFGPAVEILESYGLPERSFSTMGEVFANDNLVASPMQEWARFNYAKAQELSQSITSIPGVIQADVHIASSRKQTPFDESSPPSASVLIQMHSDMITAELVPQIKQLVAFSIPDIEYSRVGVIVSPVARVSSQGGMASFFGIVVPVDSARQLETVLIVTGGTLTVFIALTGLGAFFMLRRRKAAGEA
jgi:type III secretion protein J